MFRTLHIEQSHNDKKSKTIHIVTICPETQKHDIEKIEQFISDVRDWWFCNMEINENVWTSPGIKETYQATQEYYLVNRKNLVAIIGEKDVNNILPTPNYLNHCGADEFFNAIDYDETGDVKENLDKFIIKTNNKAWELKEANTKRQTY